MTSSRRGRASRAGRDFGSQRRAVKEEGVRKGSVRLHRAERWTIRYLCHHIVAFANVGAYTCSCTAFLSPAASLASSPHQSTFTGGRAEFFRFPQPCHRALDVEFRGECAVRMPSVPVVIHYDDRQEPRRECVLALWSVRRGVERHASSERALGRAAVAVTEITRALLELIAALDRRVPRVQHVGEAAIARDADALREKARRRLADLAEGGVSAPFDPMR